jgi:hypothetical protein
MTPEKTKINTPWDFHIWKGLNQHELFTQFVASRREEFLQFCLDQYEQFSNEEIDGEKKK